LLERLNKVYPNSPYTKQYKTELTSDEFIINDTINSGFNWNYLLYPFLALSLFANIWFWINRKKHSYKTIDKAKEQLTKQEQNILNLLLEDKSNKEIAETLFVSLSTIKTHVNNIYKKLNVQSRDDIKSLFNK
jgi:DNA-binding CsgD family transcriptional regulator